MAEATYQSNQANLRAAQRNTQNQPQSESQNPQSQSGQNYSDLKKAIHGKGNSPLNESLRNTLQNRKGSRPKGLRDRIRDRINEAKQAITQYLDVILERAWHAIPTTYGISFLWVLVHGIVKYMGNVKIFPKYGRTLGRVFLPGKPSEEAEKIAVQTITLILVLGSLANLAILIIFAIVTFAPFKILAFYAIQKAYSIWKGILSIFN